MRVILELSEEQAIALKEAADSDGRTVKNEAMILFDMVLKVVIERQKMERMERSQMPAPGTVLPMMAGPVVPMPEWMK